MSLLLSIIIAGASAKLPVQSPVFTEPFFFSAPAPAPGPEAVNASLLLLLDCQQHLPKKKKNNNKNLLYSLLMGTKLLYMDLSGCVKDWGTV